LRRDVLTEQTEACGNNQPVKTRSGWTQPEGGLLEAAEEPANRFRVQQMPAPSTAQKTDRFTANKPTVSTSSVPVIDVKRSQSLRKSTKSDGGREPELRGHLRNASAIVKPNDYTAPVSHRRQLSHLPSSTHSLPRSSSASTHNSRSTSAASTSGSVSNISTRSKTKAASNRVAAVCRTTSKETHITANRHAFLKDRTLPDQEQSQSQRSSLETTTAKSTSNRPTRPAFTTLQQHYTPKKPTKASTLSIIAASPTKLAKTHILSSDMIRLQTELLQLHLLHRTSAETQRQWEDSAESMLHHQYDGVVEGYRVLRFKQSKAQERIDLQALREWEAGHESRSFSEKVGLLSRTLQDLGNIDSAGGKFAQVVTSFERWLVMSEGAKELGKRRNFSDAKGTEFLESLGEGWRADVVALEMRVGSRALDLKRLGQPLEGSSLAYLVEICTTSVMQMSEELRTMREIEWEVLGREAELIRRAVDCIDPEDECEPENAKSPIRRPAWQTG